MSKRVHIFISYAKKDTADLAHHLTDIFNGLPGITCWMDEEENEGLQAGDIWEWKIQQQIERANLMVVLISEDINRPITETQRLSYVIKEIAYAQYLQKPVLPVLVEHTALPISIIDLQHIDLTHDEERGIEALVEEVCKRAGIESPYGYTRQQREAYERARRQMIKALEQARRDVEQHLPWEEIEARLSRVNVDLQLQAQFKAEWEALAQQWQADERQRQAHVDYERRRQRVGYYLDQAESLVQRHAPEQQIKASLKQAWSEASSYEDLHNLVRSHSAELRRAWRTEEQRRQQAAQDEANRRERAKAQATAPKRVPEQATTPAPQPLTPWLPTNWLRLLWWLFVTPAKLSPSNVLGNVSYENILRTGNWLVSTLSWLIVFIPCLGLATNTIPNSRQTEYGAWLIVIVVVWLTTDSFGDPDGCWGFLLTFVVASYPAIYVWLGIADNAVFGVRGVVVGVVACGVMFGVAVGVVFFWMDTTAETTADSPPPLTRSGVVAVSVAGGVALGVAGGADDAMLLLVPFSMVYGVTMGVTMGVAKSIARSIQRQRAYWFQPLILIALFLSYAVLIWIFWLGGYDVLS